VDTASAAGLQILYGEANVNAATDKIDCAADPGKAAVGNVGGGANEALDVGVGTQGEEGGGEEGRALALVVESDSQRRRDGEGDGCTEIQQLP